MPSQKPGVPTTAGAIPSTQHPAHPPRAVTTAPHGPAGADHSAEAGRRRRGDARGGTALLHDLQSAS